VPHECLERVKSQRHSKTAGFEVLMLKSSDWTALALLSKLTVIF
jgi:hypothetical protein